MIKELITRSRSYRRFVEKFHIETPTGVIETPVRCVTDPAAAEPAEWVLLAVKCHQIKDVAPCLKSLASPDSPIAVLHNGVEPLENRSPYAP